MATTHEQRAPLGLFAAGFGGPQQYFYARLLMASLFLVSGIRLISNWSATVGLFAKLGIPMAQFVLPLVLVLQIGGGVLLILNRHTRWVALALAAFTVASGLIGHGFWNAEPAQFVNHLNHFLKNVAICGGLLALAYEPTQCKA